MSAAGYEIGDGGPAFPHEKYQRNNEGQWGAFASGGMSLRDYFAGQALIGLCANAEYSNPWHVDFNPSLVAYSIADAMLAARKAPT